MADHDLRPVATVNGELGVAFRGLPRIFRGFTMETPLEVDVVTAAQLVREGALLLDVREPDEVATVHVAGSQHIPMRQVPEHLADLPRNRHVVVMCHHGRRSMMVTQYLRGQGYTQVTNIAGGIDAWAEQIDPNLARY
ncbi:rhodanese-like domain-containing protein [Oleiharenicola lentus]|uniref:rhodanese-like domain-containing protein n=1 Tax=Oleiharenicola lentus TaxID=2508720 RepID=UPI003F674FFF